MRTSTLGCSAFSVVLCAASHLALAGPNVISSRDTDAATRHKAAVQYAQLPIAFELNQGQSDPQVKALARGAGYGLFLTGDESVLVLAHDLDKTTLVRTKLMGANTAAHIVALDRLPGTVNSFIGNDPAKWQTNVATFAKVKYEGIYPGVDLIYYGDQGQLEYDFVVAPGADPRAIRLAISGAKARIDSHGDLVMRTSLGEVRHHKPVVYQDMDGVRREVAGRFVRHANNEVTFKLASYDRRHNLVIDPSLKFSTYLGGSGTDEARAVVVDSLGDTLIGGITASKNFPVAQCATPPVEPCAANPPPYGTYLGGNTDAFFSVIFFQPLTQGGPPGSELYISTYFGGSGADALNGLAILQTAYVPTVYAVGTTTSTDIPTTNPLQPHNAGGADAFVAILKFPNVVFFSTYLGGSGDESGNAITLDSLGNMMVAGSTTSTNFPITNPIQATNGGGLDAFVTKINSTGTGYIYSTYLGGAGTDSAAGLANGPGDVAYIVGQTTSSGFAAASQTGSATTTTNAFLAALSNTGQTEVFPTQIFGGNGSTVGKGVAVDPAGNVWLTGYTTSTDFPTMNPLQAANAGGQDAFLMEYSSAGALEFSTYYGGSGDDQALGISLVQSNLVQGSVCQTTLACLFIAGTTNSTNFPTVNPYQIANKGGYDGFITEFLLNSGSVPTVGFSTYLGSGGTDVITSVSAGRQGFPTVVGYTNSLKFPVTTGVVQPKNAGGIDAFATKINIK